MSFRSSFLIFPDVLSSWIMYGGSVHTRLTFSPPSRRSYVSGRVESPQMTRCLPRCHTSPDRAAQGFASSASTSKSSSCASPSSKESRSAISASSKPVSEMSKSMPCKASISTRSISSSHLASSAKRLSARMYAFFCASVRWSTNTHGTFSMPSARAAATRPCPARMP